MEIPAPASRKPKAWLKIWPNAAGRLQYRDTDETRNQQSPAEPLFGDSRDPGDTPKNHSAGSAGEDKPGRPGRNTIVCTDRIRDGVARMLAPVPQLPAHRRQKTKPSQTHFEPMPFLM